MKNKHHNKRRDKREKTFMAAQIGQLKVYITDISCSGCQVFLEKGLDINQEEAIFLKVALPSGQAGQGESVELKGELAWQRNVEKFSVIGLNFLDMNQECQQQLNKVVDYWNFLNSTFGSF